MDDTVAVKAMASWIVTAREAARSPVVRAELRREARGLLRNGEYDAARRIFEDILQESAPALPSFRGGTPEQICRTDQGMYLRFAEHPYETSWEFASGFIVDYSPDAEIIGLEILLPEQKQTDLVEVPLLAFGVFGSALVWLGYHYAAHSGPQMRWAALRKAGQLISAAGLRLRVAPSTPNGLTIADDDGKPLLCADFQHPPRRFLKTCSADPPAAPMEEVHSAIKHLTQSVLEANPSAIGVTVAIDEIGNLRCNSPIHPGRWLAWRGAALPGGGHASAHIAIIPPQNCAYPWLPQHFLDFPA